jgi:hypothetical protein
VNPRRAVWLGLALSGALACGELFGPPLKTAVLSIAPDFEAVGIQQAEVDRLRVRVYLDSAGAFQAEPKVDETIAIEGDSAVATFTLPILESPTRALVILDAIRSSDGLVIFSGQDTVEIRGRAVSHRRRWRSPWPTWARCRSPSASPRRTRS